MEDTLNPSDSPNRDKTTTYIPATRINPAAAKLKNDDETDVADDLIAPPGGETADDLTTPTHNNATPPDGGWGWLVVLASFVIHCIADGLVYSFGIFYIEHLDQYGSSKGETSVVSSLTVGISFVVGPVASACVERYGNRITAILGAGLASVGFCISMWSPNIYFLYFSYGILAGLGFGFLLHPAIVAVGQYFERRRSLATGIAICGSGAGTFLFPPLVQLLVDAYSWQGATLVLSAVILNCAVCGALFLPLNLKKSSETEPKIDVELDLLSHDKNDTNLEHEQKTFNGADKRNLWSRIRSNPKTKLLQNPAFLLFAISGTLTSIGYNAPFLFLPHHAELQGIGAQEGSFLISIIGVSSLVGRVFFGWLGDKIGRRRLEAFGTITVLNGLGTALCPLCTNYASLVVYAAMYGVTFGGYMAYNWVLLVDLMGLENLSPALGLVMMFDGLSTPIGAPFLGWLYDVTGTYDVSFVVGGVIIVLSGLILTPILCLRQPHTLVNKQV